MWILGLKGLRIETLKNSTLQFLGSFGWTSIRTSDWLMVALTTIKFKFKFKLIYSHLFKYNTTTIRKKRSKN